MLPPAVTLPEVLLALLLAASAWTDLRRRLILNAFTYPAIAAGLLLALARGPSALADSAAAAVLAALALWPLCRAGGMGLGDLKLLAAVGALAGTVFAGRAFVLSALAGGVMAVAWSWRTGTALAAFAAAGRLLAAAARTPFRRGGFRLPPGGPRQSIPYGLAIAAGTTASWWLRWPW